MAPPIPPPSSPRAWSWSHMYRCWYLKSRNRFSPLFLLWDKHQEVHRAGHLARRMVFKKRKKKVVFFFRAQMRLRLRHKTVEWFECRTLQLALAVDGEVLERETEREQESERTSSDPNLSILQNRNGKDSARYCMCHRRTQRDGEIGSLCPRVSGVCLSAPLGRSLIPGQSAHVWSWLGSELICTCVSVCLPVCVSASVFFVYVHAWVSWVDLDCQCWRIKALLSKAGS